MEVVLGGKFGIVGADNGVIALFEVCPSACTKSMDPLVSSGLMDNRTRCETSTVWTGLAPPFTRKFVELCELFLSCILNRMSYGNRFSISTGARSVKVIWGYNLDMSHSQYASYLVLGSFSSKLAWAWK